METKFKVLLAVGVFLVVALVYLMPKSQDSALGGRLNQAQRTVFTTTTNAFGGIPAINVNDFQNIGITAVSQSTSGTLKIVCSMQDDVSVSAFGSPTGTFQGVSNIWNFVDFVDTVTDSSIDGNTGIPMSNFSGNHQLVVRNSVFKWCSARLSGNTTPAGYGTTTVYMKPVDNQ
jgi:hypothetical protein